MKTLDLIIFQKKLKNSWATKTSQQIFIEYKQIVQ